jgi:hypothetical protein
MTGGVRRTAYSGALGARSCRTRRVEQPAEPQGPSRDGFVAGRANDLTESVYISSLSAIAALTPLEGAFRSAPDCAQRKIPSWIKDLSNVTETEKVILTQFKVSVSFDEIVGSIESFRLLS